MTIAHRGLKVKVTVMRQANAVGPTSIEGSFSSRTISHSVSPGYVRNYTHLNAALAPCHVASRYACMEAV